MKTIRFIYPFFLGTEMFGGKQGWKQYSSLLNHRENYRLGCSVKQIKV